MSQINILSQNTINQIAAGEVVDRPVNVVKELTENAIDAGATAITVEIKDGGISLIRVTDNGCGIEREQVRKAFLPHATSKINSIEDLSKLHSLGFRGEALSSISAVSQIELITKTKVELTGSRYTIAGGNEEDMEEIGAPVGTTFIVRNLFFNTPARKKFLKQPQTEGGYIAEMMEHLALSHPEISIKFILNNTVKFNTSGNGNLKDIIYRIYGREITDSLLDFQIETDEMKAWGYIGKPEVCRANRNYEVTFVNGRYVSNHQLNQAIENGYKTFLMQHKFPFAVIHFTLNSESLDINVHPSKMEIRIHNGDKIQVDLSDGIYQTIHNQQLIPKVVLTTVKEPEITIIPRSIPEPFEVNRVLENQTKYNTIINIENHSITENEKENSNENENSNQMSLFEENFLTPDATKQYTILGQIFDTYWLVAFCDKLFIIDQHAAHEKVKYERLIKHLMKKDFPSQQINPAVIIELTGKENALMKEYISFFREIGFELEAFGDSAFALRSVPLDLYGCNEKILIRDILDELMDRTYQYAADDILQRIASMACKSAVKGNTVLSTDEFKALIDELLTLDNPYTCPHGRPTIIEMSKYEIEKKFKRII